MQEQQLEGKPKIRSKTIWFNIGTLLVSVGTQFAFIGGLLPPEYQIPIALLLGTLTAIGNVILRMVTKEPLQ